MGDCVMAQLNSVDEGKPRKMDIGLYIGSLEGWTLRARKCILGWVLIQTYKVYLDARWTCKSTWYPLQPQY